jgi:protoporphyrinogen oxidase
VPEDSKSQSDANQQGRNSRTEAQTAVIIGAGPAGLTAAFELLKRTDIRPVVLEQSLEIGGISRTVNYKGNRMDIGGHRFFSKSDRVMNWWLDVMPPEASAAATEYITYHQKTRAISTKSHGAPKSASDDRVMLIRNRKSRIYFLRKFFDYPISLSANTLRNLGITRTVKIGLSYTRSLLRQIKPERSLEDFLINRFGRQLYLTFFKSYTEKVWGVPCHQISAEWGAQRIKGLSIAKALLHIARKMFANGSDVKQKKTETSLIEKFLYPKFGPGQLWEYVAEEVCQKGGEVLKGWSVDKILVEDGRVAGVEAMHQSGERRTFRGDYVFSTMPVRDLIRSLDCEIPAHVKEVSEGLMYRDFITVGVLLDKLLLSEETPAGKGLLKDNWIYIQEPDVQVGRMQIFNNWSPYLVSDPNKVWIGLEYFCYETDELWRKSDADMIALATEEMERIGVISRSDVLDGVVIRVPKTYPAYFGTYERFPELRQFIDGFENLYLIGRNGMHKYNNQDHSMLTAMTAVDNIIAGRTDKANIWAVNTEQDYHEDKGQDEKVQQRVVPEPAVQESNA